MAVYTEVSLSEAQALFKQLKLGHVTSLKGCAGGIENTNYFASAELEGQTHDYVLTLFERLSFEQLPFYLQLMKHLAQHGIAVPEPTANDKGALVFDVKSKPAAVVNKLSGAVNWHQLPSIAPKWGPCWPVCTWPDAVLSHSSPTCAA